MTDLSREEYMARFRCAEELLRQEGYSDIVNPIRFPMCRWPWLFRTLGYKFTLLYDLWRMLHCDRIYMIPQWRSSLGASIESYVAYKFGIERTPYEVTKRVSSKIVELFDIPYDKESKASM